jgi:hypothetical protein
MAELSLFNPSFSKVTNQAPILTDQGARVELIKNGYCPCGFQLRTKKLLGGWKILHEECPKCQQLVAEELPNVVSPTSTSQPTNSYHATPPPSVPPLIHLQPQMAHNKVEKKKRFCNNGVWGDYVGELDNNERRCGSGKMTWDNGNVYEGKWKDDKRNGQGIKRYADGDVYEGQWKNGKKHGQGTFRSAKGDVYEGEWKNGNKHGQGIYRYPFGAVYEGKWKDDTKHGQGIKRYADGYVYEGEWKDGKKHGQGTLRYAGCDVYEGEWKDGKKHGQRI